MIDSRLVNAPPMAPAWPSDGSRVLAHSEAIKKIINLNENFQIA